VGDDPGAVLASPPASRSLSSRWRDPRLWIGILLVLASVVVGARVLAAADDTVAVWEVNREIAAGMPIGSGDVDSTRLRFADAEDVDRYLLASEPIPVGAHLTRDVGAGELLPTASLTTTDSNVAYQLPLGVGSEGVPAGLSVGDHVDVWAVPESEEPAAEPVLVVSDTAVMSMGEAGPGGLSSDRQVLVVLPRDADVGQILAELNGSAVVLILVGG